jgi:hypothetical protein
MTQSNIGDIVKDQERRYTHDTTHISKYVDFNMYDTISTIDAYLNSKFTSGQKDELGREKPFFNICRAAANTWYRATDIDRNDIRIRATSTDTYMSAFIATILLQDWMRKNEFGKYLNEWGLKLARYGSAVTEVFEIDDDLFIRTLPWNMTIIDPVAFDDGPTIKIIEATEDKLRNNDLYNQNSVEKIIFAKEARETQNGQKKDANNANYYRLYEVHGTFSLAQFKQAKGEEPADGDEKIFFPQMHVLSYVASDNDNDDCVYLFSGKKENRTHFLHHLLEEEGRSLGIGAVESLFDTQWMVNKSKKMIADQLELASKLLFQTDDINFVGMNALSAMNTGDIMYHETGKPLAPVQNNSHDTGSIENYSEIWKRNGNEIVGISEAMLGATPKSGTAWRQTEAILTQSYNLFETMIENKGFAITEILREAVIPFLKKKLDSPKEIAAKLKSHDIATIDSRFIKNTKNSLVNKEIKSQMIAGNLPTQEEQDMLAQDVETKLQEHMSGFGDQRFIKPSEIPEKTWNEVLDDLEWDIEIDISGEARNVQEEMATLSTALKVIMTPGYAQNKEAQMIVSKILNLATGISPVEISQTQSQPQPSSQPAPQASPPQGEQMSGAVEQLQGIKQ